MNPAASRATRWAPTTNMSLAMDALQSVIEAGPGCPRLAIFCGPSGYGKTTAAAAAAAQTQSAYVCAGSLWRHKDLLKAILVELGEMRPAKTGSAMLDQIVAMLDAAPGPIIIDEMDNLVAAHMVEIIRDIHDRCNVPILMIGEERMPAKLKLWERFDNRILTIAEAQPSSLADALLLRDIYAGTVKVADDLVAHFVERTNGCARRIIININTARRAAIEDLGEMAIDLKAWGNRTVMTGDILARRRIGTAA